MNSISVPLLEGKSIWLRSIEPEVDAITWYSIARIEEMHLWTGNTVTNDINQAEEYLNRLVSVDEILSWAIARKESNEIIGTYWITKPLTRNDKLVITAEAQRIAKDYWRTGVTKEARTLIYKYVFGILKVDEVYAQAWANNINSCLSMERVGFKLIKEEEKIFKKLNQKFFEREYVLTKEAWNQKQEDV